MVVLLLCLLSRVISVRWSESLGDVRVSSVRRHGAVRVMRSDVRRGGVRGSDIPWGDIRWCCVRWSNVWWGCVRWGHVWWCGVRSGQVGWSVQTTLIAVSSCGRGGRLGRLFCRLFGGVGRYEAHGDGDKGERYLWKPNKLVAIRTSIQISKYVNSYGIVGKLQPIAMCVTKKKYICLVQTGINVLEEFFKRKFGHTIIGWRVTVTQ